MLLKTKTPPLGIFKRILGKPTRFWTYCFQRERERSCKNLSSSSHDLMKFPAPQANGRCFFAFTSVEVDTDEVARLAQHSFQLFFSHGFWVFLLKFCCGLGSKYPRGSLGAFCHKCWLWMSRFQFFLLNTEHKAVLTTSSLKHWVVPLLDSWWSFKRVQQERVDSHFESRIPRVDVICNHFRCMNPAKIKGEQASVWKARLGRW